MCLQGWLQHRHEDDEDDTEEEYLNDEEFMEVDDIEVMKTSTMMHLKSELQSVGHLLLWSMLFVCTCLPELQGSILS